MHCMTRISQQECRGILELKRREKEEIRNKKEKREKKEIKNKKEIRKR